MFRLSDLQKYYFPKNPHICLVCLKYVGTKYEIDGSRFGERFGSSKNDPKSIAIGPESLISHLGIIKTPKTLRNYIKNQEKTPKLFAVFFAS